jgi:hypothetical protein
MNAVDKINKSVYRDYPLFKGVKPRVASAADGGMTLVYTTSQKTADGLELPMQLRVKADAKGEILSVSGSR